MSHKARPGVYSYLYHGYVPDIIWFASHTGWYDVMMMMLMIGDD